MNVFRVRLKFTYRRLAHISLRLSVAVSLSAAWAVPPTMAIDTRPEFVIAVLGDSYAAGEGSPDEHGKHSLGGDLVAAECGLESYGPCFSEKWWSPDSWFENRKAVFPQQDDPGWQDDARRCHRSSKGPGAHAAMLIAARFPDVKITVLDFACSGAKITDGLLFGWPGTEPQIGTPNLPSQVAALETYVNKTSRRVDAIVMNIGGNDAGFAEIVTKCIILNSVDNDCANDPLLKKIGKLVEVVDEDDQPTPEFPNEKAPLRKRYRVVDAVFRNAGGRAGIPGLVKARPDEVYLTGLPNSSHGASKTGPPANPDNYCDGTQSRDVAKTISVAGIKISLPGYIGYRDVSRGESETIEDLVGGNNNSINASMKQAADLHGWNFINMFDITRNHGVCANGSSFFRTNQDGLIIQGDEGLLADFPIIGPLLISGAMPVVISPGIVHQNEDGYEARAKLIANVVGEQVRMRFSPPTLSLAGVEVGTASKASFTWMDPSPLHLPETRWELEFMKRGVLSNQSVFSDSADSLNGELTETPSASGRVLSWRVPQSGEFTARVRGCRATPTGGYCGPFSNAVTVVTFVPDTPVELKRLRLPQIPQNKDAIGVEWTPGNRTPVSVRYEVVSGPPCPPGPLSGRICGFGSGKSGPAPTPTSSTKFVRESDASGKNVFQVRACSTAGCSPYTPPLIVEHFSIVSPVRPDIPDSLREIPVRPDIPEIPVQLDLPTPR